MEGITIKEASKMLEVESHVLRYWEEELELKINRNQMGHRYYDDKDIKLFTEIRNLRERGVSLKEIKSAVDSVRKENLLLGSEGGDNEKDNEMKNEYEEKNIEDVDTNESKNKNIQNCFEEKQDEEKNALKIVDFKQAQLQSIMNKIVASALQENKNIISTSLKAEITEDVAKQIDTLLKEKEEREEERFRHLDESIRRIQEVDSLIAATKVRKKRWWRK